MKKVEENKLLLKESIPFGIESTCYVKVVVAPIGNISRHVFMKYLTLIKNEFGLLPMYSLTRFTKDNHKSPFKRQNWKNAKLQITYMYNTKISQTNDLKVYNSIVYRSAFEEIHCFLGIVSCRHNLKEQYLEFERMKKSFPQLKSSRLLAVEYETETQTIPTEEEMNKLPDLIVILPALEYMKLRFYVERAICDLMNSFVKKVERIVPHPERLGSDLIKIKKYAYHALLIGDLTDAAETFKKLQRLTNKDIGFLALSKIGLSCCILLSCSNDEEIRSVYDNIITLYEEAFVLFIRRGMIDPHLIEAYLRLASFCTVHNRKEGDRRKEDALRYISVAVTRTKKHCKTERAIYYLKLAADLCIRAGCERKRGMILMMLAEMYYKKSEPHIATQMVFRAFRPYKIPFKVGLKDQKWEFIPELVGEGWKEVQIDVIKKLVYQYSVNDALTRARLIFFLLSSYHKNLLPKEQAQYFRRLDRLCQGTGPGIPPQAKVCLSSLPILRSVKPKETQCVPKKDVRKEENGVFIFVPDSFKKTLFGDVNAKKDIILVEGEVCTVEVSFYNPFHEVIRLRNISFRTNIKCKVYQASLNVRPRRRERVMIQFVPNGVGDLKITEVVFYINSVSNLLTIPCEGMTHKFLGVTVLEALPLIQTNFTYPTLTLHEGETIQNHFDIKNLSELVGVERLEIRCVNDGDGIVSMTKPAPKYIPPKGTESVTLEFLVKEGDHRNFKRKQFMFEVKYGRKEWVRKISTSLWVNCLRNLKIRRDDKFIRIQNTSVNESFLVYLKNGMTLNVPPNHSKILFRRELKRWQSQNNLFVSASEPIPTKTVSEVPAFGSLLKRSLKSEDNFGAGGKLFTVKGPKKRDVRVLEEVFLEVEVNLETLEVERRNEVKLVISSDPRVSCMIGKSEIFSVMVKGVYSAKIFFLKEGKFVINVFLVDTSQKIELDSEKILVVVKYSS